MGLHALLLEIFPTQGSNPGVPHCRWILYHLSHQGSPRILECVAYPFSRGSSCPGTESGSPAFQAVILYQLSYQRCPVLMLQRDNSCKAMSTVPGIYYTPNKWLLLLFRGLPWWLSGKESNCNAEYLDSISGSGRSPGKGNGYPLQCSCLENSMDRGSWWATKSWTRLSD